MNLATFPLIVPSAGEKMEKPSHSAEVRRDGEVWGEEGVR